MDLEEKQKFDALPPADRIFFSEFTGALKDGLFVKKATRRGLKPKRRILYSSYDMSSFNYKAPDTTVSISKYNFLFSGQSTTKADMITANLFKVKGTKYPEGRGLITIYFKLPHSEFSIITETEAEFNYYLKGFKMVQKVYGTFDPTGCLDDRQFHAPSVEDYNKVVNYKPLVYKYYGVDGSIKEIQIGCGYSSEDLCYFTCFYLALWSFVLGLFALLLKANLDTDENSIALWFYFVLFILLVAVAFVSITVNQINRAKELAKQKAEEAEMAEKAEA